LTLTAAACLPSITFYIYSFVTDAATTEIYTLSLHDALPIFIVNQLMEVPFAERNEAWRDRFLENIAGANLKLGDPEVILSNDGLDRKSTRLNSSHVKSSYAVFCLKKKKGMKREPRQLVDRPVPREHRHAVENELSRRQRSGQDIHQASVAPPQHMVHFALRPAAAA